MTKTERDELIQARAVGMAAMLCIQQLYRVLQEANTITTTQLQDAISEAVAAAATAPTAPTESPMHAEMSRGVVKAIKLAFSD